MEKTVNKTKVRYTVQYNGRNYEYALHSEKKHFIRNIADVVNVLEYCVTQHLKNNLYKFDNLMYNFNVNRMVNDKLDETFDASKQHGFMVFVQGLIDQMVVDTIARNK